MSSASTNIFAPGQVHASHLHGPFQYFYVLAFGEQLHRHAIEAFLCLYDFDHLSSADSTTATSILTFPRAI